MPGEPHEFHRFISRRDWNKTKRLAEKAIPIWEFSECGFRDTYFARLSRRSDFGAEVHRVTCHSFSVNEYLAPVNGCPSRPLLFRWQSVGQLTQVLMEPDHGICSRFNCRKTEQRAVSGRVEELSLSSDHGVGQKVKVLLLKSSSCHVTEA